MPYKNLNIGIILLVFFFACKDTNSPESPEISTTEQDSITEVTARNEPEHMTIYIWVEKLRMRAQPDTKSDIIAELKEGEAVFFLDEKSNFTQKITLRGKQYDEPWLKVKTSNNQEGWVYGGGVKFYKPKIDVTPSPYDACMDLRKRRREQAYQDCIGRIMDKQLRKDERRVKKIERGYEFTLLSGEKKQLVFGEPEAGTSDIPHFDYRYYISKIGYFVTETSGGGLSEYRLINDKSGNEISIWGFPKASPDYKHVAAINANLSTPESNNNGVQILGFTDQGLQVIWEKTIKSLEPIQSKWLDQNTIAISFRPPPNKSLIKIKTLELKMDEKGEWAFSEEIE